MDYNDEDIKQILHETKKIRLPVFNEDKAWNNINYQTNTNNTIKILPTKILKYAAVIFFGLFLGALVSKTSMFSNKDKYIEINASQGQKVDISLPDGNKIWINSNSSIRYPANFEEFNKKIYVKGEMYFDFSQNNLEPLSVIVNDVVIQGFNTAFNIKTTKNNESAQITVTKGWITVNNPEAKVSNLVVEEGYTCFFSNELPIFIEENKNTNYLAWKTGELHFDNMPLKLVATVLSEYYKMPVSVNGKIGYCNFSSDYKNADIKTILNDIKEKLKPDINIKNTRIIISGNDC